MRIDRLRSVSGSAPRGDVDRTQIQPRTALFRPGDAPGPVAIEELTSNRITTATDTSQKSNSAPGLLTETFLQGQPRKQQNQPSSNEAGCSK